MGLRSTRENKNIYFQSREEAGLTRAQASEAAGCLSESQIEKIEYDKAVVNPEDVAALSKAYNKPSLCNHYCSHECPIGHGTVPEVPLKDLSQIILQMIASLNALENKKDRLIEITADGNISDNELHDFAVIEKQLDQISLTVESLKLWGKSTIAAGKIDLKELDKARKKLDDPKRD